MEQRTLDVVVSEFRRGLEDLVSSGFYFNISITKQFPHASCDDSSRLLAAYLTDHGFPGALRIDGKWGGRDGELGSHVWLSLDGKIIDITGDQFGWRGYCQPDILIADHDDFLSTFKLEPDPELADYRLSDIPQYDFNNAYDAVIEVIRNKV